MAWETPHLHIPGAVAAGDLSANQYRFVVKNTNANEYALNTTEGGVVDGVLQNKPDAQGKQASIATAGWSKVEAGAAVAIGDLVQSSTAGKALTAASGDYAAGRALTAASADGEIITIDLHCFGFQP